MKVFQKGATSRTIYLMIRDTGSTPVGMGKTGLAFNTAGLNISYARNKAARVAITLATQTVTGAYSSGGFVEVDGTNMPGMYRLDIPDLALATGVDDVRVHVKGTGIVDDYLHIDLVDYDPVAAPESSAQVADAIWDELLSGHAIAGSSGERMSRIPNVAPATNGGLPTVDANNAVKVQSGAGANQIDLVNGAVKIAAAGFDAVLDAANLIETGLTLRGHFRLSASATYGRSSGLGTASAVFNNAIANTKARITSAVDANGNRGVTTYDQT